MKKDLLLFNGLIVTENEILENHSIVIKDGIISSILLNDKIINPHNFEIINCDNKYILPGLIDIHSDSIEKIIVPRKGVKFGLELALHEMDQQLPHQGITTIYHSLSMAETTICNNIRTITPSDIFKLCELLNNTRNLLVRHKIHVRLELNTINVYKELINYIDKGIIHELSFMDHTPGQGQYKDILMFEKVITQQYGNISKGDREQIIKICKEKEKLSYDKLLFLISLSNEKNIPMAYHDVESNEQVDWMVSNNIKICEFPLNSTVSEYALLNGLFCVVGAPNVILGKSHYNNASAIELLSNNRANILSSDYFSTSLLQAIFKLYKEVNLPLNTSVNFATLNPAKALGISDKYGSIKENKTADIIIVDTYGNIPKVIMTLVNGSVKYFAKFS